MGIILWIIFGAIAGWIASLIMRTDNEQGFLMDVVLGIVGGVVGGFLMSIFGQPGVTGFDLYSLVVAVIGAVALIAVGRALTVHR
ncbi:MAG TPA: GlsB/YeaQ/YmgE family stress response membrane protein [Patescibacteria group bacterium]|nr:GlsB/YeaQ/YmgE family stress response membrane protein [Patescibacteria group bacterium]